MFGARIKIRWEEQPFDSLAIRLRTMDLKHINPVSRVSIYIVGCGGASQLGVP